MAAYLGDPDALSLLSAPLPAAWTPFSRTTDDTARWIAGLRPWGKEPSIRACRIAAAAWVPLLLPRCAPRALALLEAVEPTIRSWVLEPSEATGHAAGRLAARLAREPRGAIPARTLLMGLLCATAARRRAAAEAARALRAADVEPPGVSARAAKRSGLGRGRLRARVSAELLPWALGERDPLRQ